MTDSLRDQLLGLGFKPAPKPERKPDRRPDQRRDAQKPTGKGAAHPKPSHGGKIKRIYVNAAQLKALNAGELGVVQQNGRYLLVTAAVLAEAEAIFAPAVALKIDPDAPADQDPNADPQYQVPDDLVW